LLSPLHLPGRQPLREGDIALPFASASFGEKPGTTRRWW